MSPKTTVKFERLETRDLLTSVGWDGPGRGSAELTYYIGEGPSYLTDEQVESALESALDAWADVVDVTFTETNIPNQRDSIDFTFQRLDGSGGTLAQAYLPDDVNPARIAGDVQFDTSERWEIGNGLGRSAFDLVLVAVHEIGHALGIEHSHDHSSVMAPTVSAIQAFSQLHSSDVDAALEIYSEPATGASNTPPVAANPSSPNHGHSTHTTHGTDTDSSDDERTDQSNRIPRWTGWSYQPFYRYYFGFGRSPWFTSFRFNFGNRFTIYFR